MNKHNDPIWNKVGFISFTLLPLYLCLLFLFRYIGLNKLNTLILSLSISFVIYAPLIIERIYWKYSIKTVNIFLRITISVTVTIFADLIWLYENKTNLNDWKQFEHYTEYLPDILKYVFMVMVASLFISYFIIEIIARLNGEKRNFF